MTAGPSRSPGVQIVCKPTASVMDSFACTVIKALELHMTIILEPKLFALMLKQLRRALEDCSALAAVDGEQEHPHALDPAAAAAVGECLLDSEDRPAGRRGGCGRPSLHRHSAGARLISSRVMGGSMPVKLSQLEAAQEFESDPSAMITARGRLGAKLTVTEEALDMAEALKDAFMRQMYSLQSALDSVIAARGDLPIETADLVSVRHPFSHLPRRSCLRGTCVIANRLLARTGESRCAQHRCVLIVRSWVEHPRLHRPDAELCV